MKMDVVAGSGNDEFYTPSYAVIPILKYIPAGSTVWCPFDTGESNFVRLLTASGHKVIDTHISNGHDFFGTDVPSGVEYVVSNPPYSRKADVLQRLFSLKVKFAMLVGVVGLFESQRRFEMFSSNKFEIMYMNRRVSYFKDFADEKPSLNPPFSSVYVTSGVLPSQIVFEEISK